MAKSKKTRVRRQTSQSGANRAKWLAISEIGTKFLEFLATATRFIAPSWAVVEVVRSLAGETTIIDVAVLWFKTSGSAPLVSVSISLNALLLGFGYYQHRSRQRAIKIFAKQRKALERQLDPHRTGSGLPEDGDDPNDDDTPPGNESDV